MSNIKNAKSEISLILETDIPLHIYGYILASIKTMKDIQKIAWIFFVIQSFL